MLGERASGAGGARSKPGRRRCWPSDHASPDEPAQLERRGMRALDARDVPRGRPRPPPRAGAPPTSASARARSASTFVRSSAETPDARNVGSTPSCSASHSIVAGVGRVFPRSIWLMYSFENRSPASCDCVSPAATRSARTRARQAGCRRSSRSRRSWRSQSCPFRSEPGIRPDRAPPRGGCLDRRAESSNPTRNHLTKLLDFFGHGSYSQAHTAPTDARSDAQASPPDPPASVGERGWAAEPRILRLAAPGRGRLERKTPPEPQPGAFSFAGGTYGSPRGPPSLASGHERRWTGLRASESPYGLRTCRRLGSVLRTLGRPLPGSRRARRPEGDSLARRPGRTLLATRR